MLKKMKWIIYTPQFIFLAYYLIRLYSLTFRLRVENETPWRTALENGQPVLICTWHQQFFSAIRYFNTYAKYTPGLMISQSRDGDLISGVANRTGWHTPRGSSSRGGKSAMDAMISHIRRFGFGAHVLDGPRGPMGTVKAGLIKMAQETGAMVVPFHVTASRAWFFNSWDYFMLPKPFSRVTLTYGRGRTFAPTESLGDFERQRKRFEDRIRPNLIFPDLPPARRTP